jgi:putative ABC transport system substrate-binding protein
LLKTTASTTPIVFVGVGDPIGDGFVASLAHPRDNITGFAGFDGAIGGKWLEVLKETVPHMTRVMMIMHPDTPIHQAFWRSLETAAAKENDGIIVKPHALTWANEDLIVAPTLQHRVPSHFATAASVKAGGLEATGAPSSFAV